MKAAASESQLPAPLICGCAGTELTAAERDFFAAANPFGFILMSRNCETPEQVRGLTAALRATVDRDNAPILIDQEGGRVARLKPPHWPQFPPAAAIGAAYAQDPAFGVELAGVTGGLIGNELRQIGINVNCAPVLDLSYPETHEAIGDRAYGGDSEAVTALARAFAASMITQGVLPVVKHMPGHGRAAVDPHLALPTVTQERADLAADFAPFHALRDMPIGMSSHILFQSIDRTQPASLSLRVIRDIIRGDIGFDGLLLSDDLDMGALTGTLAERARRALAAGTDVVLVCNSGLLALEELMASLPPMAKATWPRWLRAWKRIDPKAKPSPFEDPPPKTIAAMIQKSGG